MATVAAPTPRPTNRKKLLRRAGVDRSQTLRRAVQLAFFALNAWTGVEFYLFVRYYETGGRSVWAGRPPGVEGWLPIASMMNLKVLLASGEMPRLHPAGMFLLIAFLAASWIFRKSFCGWLCPVGTASEYLWRLGRQTFGRNFRLPRKLDVGLRGLKYGVTRDYVMGLEVVLADGRVARLGNACVKDVAGYSLKDLFVGSEGTLGIITEVLLKLVPRPAGLASPVRGSDRPVGRRGATG